jgi:preprotein translocase subunit YajC
MHVLALLAAEETTNSSGGLIQIGILLLIPLAMYFLMIRPQRRRLREQQAMQSSLQIGDEVMTSSGIYGFITGFEDDIAWVEIDDDVQIRVTRSALSGRVGGTGSAPAASDSSTDDEPTDAKDAGSGATGTAAVPPTVNPTVKGVRGRGGAAKAGNGGGGKAGTASSADADRTPQE